MRPKSSMLPRSKLPYIVFAAGLVLSLIYFTIMYTTRIDPSRNQLPKNELQNFITFRPEIAEKIFLGNPNASLTIIVYSNPSTATFKNYYREVFAYIDSEYLSKGKARYYHKDYLLPDDVKKKSFNFNVSRYLYCLASQNKSGYWTNFFYLANSTDAQAIIMETEVNRDCYESSYSYLEKEANENLLFGIISVPTMFVGINGFDNSVIYGIPSVQDFRRVIRQKEISLGI